MKTTWAHLHAYTCGAITTTIAHVVRPIYLGSHDAQHEPSEVAHYLRVLVDGVEQHHEHVCDTAPDVDRVPAEVTSRALDLLRECVAALIADGETDTADARRVLAMAEAMGEDAQFSQRATLVPGKESEAA